MVISMVAGLMIAVGGVILLTARRQAEAPVQIRVRPRRRT